MDEKNEQAEDKKTEESIAMTPEEKVAAEEKAAAEKKKNRIGFIVLVGILCVLIYLMAK